MSLDAQARFTGAGVGDLADRLDTHGDYRVTLNLQIPFGGSDARAEERAKLAARIGHMKATRGLATARRELDIEVREAVEQVRREARRVRLAGEALELARKTAWIEEGRLRRGLTSSYRMGRIRSDLASAATAELNARIDYLNAVTRLSRVEGTVLERWGIVVDDATAEAVMERRGDGEGPGGARLVEPAPASARREGAAVALGVPDHALMLRLSPEPVRPESTGLRLSAGGVDVVLPAGER